MLPSYVWSSVSLKFWLRFVPVLESSKRNESPVLVIIAWSRNRKQRHVSFSKKNWKFLNLLPSAYGFSSARQEIPSIETFDFIISLCYLGTMLTLRGFSLPLHVSSTNSFHFLKFSTCSSELIVSIIFITLPFLLLLSAGDNVAEKR